MADVVVVYSPVGGGHKAAALALVEAARARGDSALLLDAFEHAPKLFGGAYLGAHLAGQNAAPGLYGSAYSAANHRGGALDPLRRGVDHVAFLPLLKRVCALKPRVVFATHHLPLVVLGRARRKGWLDAPLVGVVTDYTAHACWAESGVDAFAVPCPRARHELMLHGIEPPRIAVTGLPVRAAFERVRSLRAPAPGERLRVLVTSGGFGVGPIARVVESFAGIDGVELVVVCGRATKLVERVTRVAAEAGVRARVVGFERNMAARVGEAHVVVGKAGGLTISEAMTAGRPLAIVAAVPGNESLNEEFVVDGGGGIASTPDDVGEAIAALHAAGALVEMGRRAAGLVLRAAAERVLELGDALSGRPSLADAA
ncbi:MAG: MGDG synthase family glycosyltransferase [Polyangiaceae bacterium]